MKYYNLINRVVVPVLFGIGMPVVLVADRVVGSVDMAVRRVRYRRAMRKVQTAFGKDN